MVEVQLTLATAEEIYEQVVKPLPAEERLRLVEKIVHDLSSPPVESEPHKRYEWMSLRGIAPNLLEGEDAQAWVTRTRSEIVRNATYGQAQETIFESCL